LPSFCFADFSLSDFFLGCHTFKVALGTCSPPKTNLPGRISTQAASPLKGNKLRRRKRKRKKQGKEIYISTIFYSENNILLGSRTEGKREKKKGKRKISCPKLNV